MTPAKRFFSLLRLDSKDVSQIFFYALFAGFISLSLPLGIQAIINFIQSGRVSVSWIVLVIFVIAGVALVGILSLMQLRITENLQQKIFVRSSFEFAYRLPKIRFGETHTNVYPPEIANRFFDTMSIQKGVSKLLIDFSSALLQISFGIILLSLYHPFFILFGILLIVLLYLIFKFSYRPGLETSLSESKYKYKAADWLQEIARNTSSFRTILNFNFALDKNNTLVEGYLKYREQHFNIIRRQFIQLIIFKIIITAGLLLIGGFLVINQQMNIGQFVAAEIVILLVINSVEKIIIGLESFYDVLTSVEKIGQVSDMDLDDEKYSDVLPEGTEMTIAAENVRFHYPDAKKDALKNVNLQILPGEKILLQGNNGAGKTTLIRILSGLLQPTSGTLSINDDSLLKIDPASYRARIGYIIQGETPFEGTIRENITFNNPSITMEDLRWALDAVQLTDFVKSLPDGLDTKIFPEGRHLSSSNAQKILLARSIVHRPSILFYEDPTDRMDNEATKAIIKFIFSDKNPWTVVVSSASLHWEEGATRRITMENGKIINDQYFTPC
ncbi:peptidase domain-containing ABC transporter [Flavobacterium lindanitolerans]|uniref:peptidase domain-containing ABC transporter n=1 Tax=Flavobacterium lindanitolerans TaxID=428988 RepID=UPI0031D57D9D